MDGCSEMHEGAVLEMNGIFIVVFTFLSLMTLLSIYMLVTL